MGMDAGMQGSWGVGVASVASGINSDLHCVRAVEEQKNRAKCEHLFTMFQPACLHQSKKSICWQQRKNICWDPKAIEVEAPVQDSRVVDAVTAQCDAEE